MNCVIQDMKNVSSFEKCLGYEVCFAEISKEKFSGNIRNVFGEEL